MIDSPSSHPESESDFVRDLAQTEQTLVQLKRRYQQIQEAQQQQEQLQNKHEQISQEWERTQLPELSHQLERMKNQLDELHLILESELLSNDDLMRLYREEIRQGLLGEIFWQIVRFGGVGVLLGWLLKTWASS